MGIFGQVVIAGRKKPKLVVVLAHDAIVFHGTGLQRLRSPARGPRRAR
jgi:hypothetical protein